MKVEKQHLRTAMLIGKEGLFALHNAGVVVCGLGGVGSYAAEALVRSGIGKLLIIDHDTIAPSNINRQLPALNSTVGLFKTDVMKKRLADINPEAEITAKRIFIDSSCDPSVLEGYDYIIDAIDTVSAKVWLCKAAAQLKIPIISAMGAGNKTDPSQLRVADIFDTSVCPLCRSVRHKLREEGIESLRVVYSKEPPFSTFAAETRSASGRPAPASMIFVPAAAGLLLAREVVFDLTALNHNTASKTTD